MDATTTTTELWAILELMGHVKLAGRVSEVEMFGQKLGRIDIPQPDGTFVSQFFGGSSIYRITPATEAVARDVARRCNDAAPVMPWDYPKPNDHTALPPQRTATIDPDDGDDFDDPRDNTW